MVLSNVDFPAPLGPIRPTSCPRSAWRSTPSNSVLPSISYVRSCALIACWLLPFMVCYSARLKGVFDGSGKSFGHRIRARSSAPRMFQ